MILHAVGSRRMDLMFILIKAPNKVRRNIITVSKHLVLSHPIYILANVSTNLLNILSVGLSLDDL